MNDQDMLPEYDFSNGKRGAIDRLPAGKERITIRLDKDVLDWFRQQVISVGGGNYQTMINQVLRDYVFSRERSLEELVRRAVREELAEYRSQNSGE
jgi:uncharacterized protein (DUF4415 family)